MSAIYIHPLSKRKEDFSSQTFMDFISSSLLFPNYLNDHQRARVNETNDTITLELDMPGIQKSNLSITYQQDELQIKTTTGEDTRRNYHYQYTVPGIDIKKSSAKLNDGILTLSLEKTNDIKPQSLTIS
ncbi:MAG: Hsp20/alpha crystallin family protein [Candidatus Marinamargulisbacteria bacterium]